MVSRGKRMVQIACENYLQSSTETLFEQNDSTSADVSYNNGYIELSPVIIKTHANQECIGNNNPYTSTAGWSKNLCLSSVPITIENVSDIITEENSDGHILIISDKDQNKQSESEDDSVRDKDYVYDSSFDSDDSYELDLPTMTTGKKDEPPKESLHELEEEEVLNEGIQNVNVEEDQGQRKENLEKKCRKRKRNTNEWKRNIKKQKHNSGEEYTNSKNQLIPKRKLKSPCNEKCRYKCYSVILEEERESILKSFWKIGDNTRQRQYISSNMENVDPKYRYPTKNGNRSHNQAYFLRRNDEKIRVCKKFFMGTLDIGNTMIRTTIKKRDSNLIVESDKRGKHRKQKALNPALKDTVRNHINSIPRVESHYLRNQTKREYFEGSLNIATLYRLYKEKCLEENSHYVKKSMYENIFNTEFNIGFHKPKKDQCATNEEGKTQLEETYNKHLTDKELSREEKSKDVEDAKTNKNKVVAVYDLQAVLPSPSGEVSSFYYKSKLSTYNFNIYDIVPKQGYCYVWSEHCAKRGSNEIATCVLNFLTKHANGKSVVFFSDNCAGQNKNKFIAAMYSYAVSKLNIPNITHKFLLTGHTQNEGDSMHSCIEREKSFK